MSETGRDLGREPEDVDAAALDAVVGRPTALTPGHGDDPELASFVTSLAEGEAALAPPPLPDDHLDLGRFVSAAPPQQVPLRRRSGSSRRRQRRRRGRQAAAAVAVAVIVVLAVAAVLLG